MLKDITLGQYFPLDSPIHKLDPRTKIIFTLLYIGLVFFADSLWGYLTVAVFCFLIIVLLKIYFFVILKSIKPMIFIIMFTAAINVLFTGGEDILWKYKFLLFLFLNFIFEDNLVFAIFFCKILCYTDKNRKVIAVLLAVFSQTV